MFMNFILPKGESEHLANMQLPLQMHAQTNQLKKIEVIPQFTPRSSFQLCDPKPALSVFFFPR